MQLKSILAILSVLAVLTLVGGCEQSGVSISGDGSQVAVSHGGKLWVADVEHENWRKVDVEGESANSPTSSPNGRYVVFCVSKTTTTGDQANPETTITQSGAIL